jgi:hypothetical protein
MELAGGWRHAIEGSDLADHPIFQRFPHGSCGDSSRTLAKFLESHGVTGVEYVLGGSVSHPQGLPTHAWLEIGGIIVDITADQFEWYPGPAVIVGRDRTWHSQFAERDRDTNTLEDYSQPQLLDLYDRILHQVPARLRPR